MSVAVLEAELADGVATLRLNRPAVRNALNADLVAALGSALDRAGADPAVRCVVLTGRGDAFCAGADMAWMQQMDGLEPEQRQAEVLALAMLYRTLYHCPKPTIARVKGFAVGGGMGLAATCDFVMADRTARFSLGELRVGLLPAIIAPYVLRALGARQTRHLLLSGDPVLAEEAWRIGWVYRVCEPDMLDENVAALANSLLRAGPTALTRAKKMMDEVVGRPLDDSLVQYTADLMGELRVSPEGREGMAAFLEKRSPAWVKPR